MISWYAYQRNLCIDLIKKGFEQLELGLVEGNGCFVDGWMVVDEIAKED